MPIKLKNISVAERSDPLQVHIKSFLSPTKEKLKYAEERLKAACKAADLIKKNSDLPEKDSKSSDPLKTAEAKDKLSVLSAAVAKPGQVNHQNQQTILEYLSEQDGLRKQNQLVYGKSSGDSDLNHLGLGLIENQDKSKASFYQRKIRSTYAHSVGGDHVFRGAAEFGVTYDNKIFIVPVPMPGASIVNLYKMAQGTLLKAVGCIQIGNRQVEERSPEGESYAKVLEGQINYISVYNAFFDAPIENIAVSLFALQRLGIDLCDTKVVIPNDNAGLIELRDSDCKINLKGKIQNAAYYLDETRFPGAKALVEKELTFLDKIRELFCSIDDQVLLKRNKRFIEQIYGEKELLKLNLIKLFNCTEELIKDTEVTEKKAKVTKTEPGLQNDIHQPSTSAVGVLNQTTQSETDNAEEQVGFNDYWLAIKNNIQIFKEKNIDLSFLAAEINMILAYILQNKLTSEEKDKLQELIIPERIPGRGLDDKNISSFVTFYENDPITTCINLLRDYSKGQGLPGALKRFFSLAWNRHYIRSVNQFLRDYDRKELPDNLTIDNIFNKLQAYGATISLHDNKSTLLNRLVFCAKLMGKKSDLVPILDVDCVAPVTEVPIHQPVLRLHSQPYTPPTQPTWAPTPIVVTMPPPLSLADSPTGSIEPLINRTKIGSYPETNNFENSFLHQQMRPRSVSEASKKNLLSSIFVIDADKGLQPIELGQQKTGSAGPPSPRVSGL